VVQPHPDRVMADPEGLPEFFERGIRMFCYVETEFLRVQFPPMPPTGFGCQRTGSLGRQIAVYRAASDVKPPGRLGFGSPVLDKDDDTFA